MRVLITGASSGIGRDMARILNVASIAGFMPGPLMAAYYASKSYVVRLSESVKEELKKKSTIKKSYWHELRNVHIERFFYMICKKTTKYAKTLKNYKKYIDRKYKQ